jgi:hypothetical protein
MGGRLLAADSEAVSEWKADAVARGCGWDCGWGCEKAEEASADSVGDVALLPGDGEAGGR